MSNQLILDNLKHPDVIVTEVIASAIPEVDKRSISGLVGNFQWGAVDKVQYVKRKSFRQIFGKSTDYNYQTYLSGYYYFSFSEMIDLACVRVIDEKARNASDTGLKDLVIKNTEDFEIVRNLTGEWDAMFSARFAGDLGNSIGVIVIDSSNWADVDPTYRAQFDAPPSTSISVEKVGGKNDQIHILVVDRQGKFTNRVGTVLEKFTALSKAVDAKVDGSPQLSSYYVNNINLNSNYIYALDLPTADLFTGVEKELKGITVETDPTEKWESPTIEITGDGTGAQATIKTLEDDTDPLNIKYSLEVTVVSAGKDYTFYNVEVKDSVDASKSPLKVTLDIVDAPNAEKGSLWGVNSMINGVPTVFAQLKEAIDVRLIGGIDAETTPTNEIYNAYEKLINAKVGYLITADAGGEANWSTVSRKAMSETERSKFTLACVSPRISSYTRTSNDSEQTDYVLIDADNLRTKSTYTNFVDSYCRVVDVDNNKIRLIPTNFIMAGLNARVDAEFGLQFSPAGTRRGVIPADIEILQLATNTQMDRLYPQGINSFRETKAGVALWGDRTFYALRIPQQNIQVRKVMIYIMSVVEQLSEAGLFENNNRYTRNKIRSNIKRELDSLVSAGAIEEYGIKLDESNNPIGAQARQQMFIQIKIRPVKSVNFIHVSIEADDYSVNFDEFND